MLTRTLVGRSSEYVQLEEPGLVARSSELEPRRKFLHGWRFTVCIGAGVTFLVFWANVGLLIWVQRTNVYTKVSGDGDVVDKYQGTCPERNRIIRWSHIAINALSTLLLAASSACMQ